MVAARILRAAETMRAPIVATDGDGTLWRGDIGDDLFFALCDGDVMASPMHERLVFEARAHGIAYHGSPGALGRRLFDAHGEGSFPELLMFELMACAFAGWRRGDVDAFARRALAHAGIATRLHPEVEALLGVISRAGIEIVVVSASPRAAVDAAIALTPLQGMVTHAIAADAVFVEDVMSPEVVRPIPYAEGKKTALADREIAGALGDNAFDLAMLAAAVVPVAVRAKPRLVALAETLPRMVALLPLGD